MPESLSVLCFGALHYDSVAQCFEPFALRTSNPVRARTVPGGVAHNVARNLAGLGATVGLSSLVGGDGEGDRLLSLLDDYRIDRKLVQRLSDSTTARYTAVLGPDGELAAGLADMEIYERYDIQHLERHLAQARRWPVWLADANLPEETLAQLARQKGDRLLCAAPVSAAKALRWRDCLAQVDILVANALEAEALTGIAVADRDAAVAAAQALRAQGPRYVVVTRGSDGVVLASGDTTGHWGVPDRPVVDVNGAGDAFLAGFLYFLGRGGTPVEAVSGGLALASLTAEAEAPVRPDLKPALVQARQADVPAMAGLSEELV